jgi:hypothetical protein
MKPNLIKVGLFLFEPIRILKYDYLAEALHIYTNIYIFFIKQKYIILFLFTTSSKG